MEPEYPFEVGQLVEYRSWYDGEGAWISLDNQVGIVLEVLVISNDDIESLRDIVLYDVRVYWVIEGVIENVPDLLLAEYGSEGVDFV